MSRFDWADQGIFDISDLSEDDFRDLFNQMPPEKKAEIVAALTDETANAEEKAKAVAFVTTVGRLVMKAGTLLV